MTDLQKAKQLLGEGNYTCVLCRGEKILTSTLRGVRPLVEWYELNGENHAGWAAADRVVGRGAAFLYVLLGMKAVYAHVISRAALEVLQAQGIWVEYQTVTEHIVNRKGDGLCPFEAAVLEITDPFDAYRAIRCKMEEMGLV